MKKILFLLLAFFLQISCYSQTSKEYFDRGVTKNKVKDYIGAIADFNMAISVLGGRTHNLTTLDFRHTAIDSIIFYKGKIITEVLRFPESMAFMTSSIDSTIASIDSIHIRRKADFSDATFISNADFSDATFDNSVDFSRTTFDSTSSFIMSTFDDSVNFSRAMFNNSSSFLGSTFNNSVDFSNATFQKSADFFDAIFYKRAIFKNTVFDHFADFSFAKFGSLADFSNLTISDTTRFKFSSTILPDTINFSFDSKIDNVIDLSVADFTGDLNRYNKELDEFRKPYLILFYRTDISKFHCDYIHFSLLLPDSIRDPAYMRKYILISNDEKESIYEALLNNFKIRGQEESYRLLDIEYKKFKLHIHRYTIPLSWINSAWWNFGYTKGRVFAWTFLFIVLFTFINYFYLSYLNKKVYTLENIPPSNEMKNRKQRIWYSFVYTSTIFFRLTLKIENINFQNKGGTIYLIFIYTLGLVCLAYMANFVLQK